MTENKKFMDAMQADIENAAIPDSEKSKLLKNLLSLKDKKINLMITGATGCGKSSTINALFGEERAKVGIGVDPETMEIERYDLGNLILWDSPGLGDGKEADNRHAKNIINKLLEKDSEGNLLIDMVLVILDGSSRDLGTSYQLINEVIIPNLGENKANRILVAINKVDSALNGRHWNWDENKPDAKLQDFMDEKADSVRRRIKEGTGVDIEPICYKAGFKEEGEAQDPPYNLTKLFSYILKYTPKEKRIVYMDNVNQNPEMWKDNDGLRDYSQSVKSSFLETFTDCIGKGADIGEAIGGIFGAPGRAIGRIAGGIIGGIGGAISSLFGW